MVRLLLLSSPALCLLSGVGLSELIHFFVKQYKYYSEDAEKDYINGTVTTQAKLDTKSPSISKGKGSVFQQPKSENSAIITEVKLKPRKVSRYGIELVVVFVLAVISLLTSYILHCTWVGAEAYSSPSIILANKDRFGNKHIIDDFREAYYWLRMNTKSDAKIVSWWDYGYQIAGMSNRAVIVDNNTWNTTHIATVGATFANEEEESFRICKMLDANYVLVIFGGKSAYSGDDINKFIWIIRITGILNLIFSWILSKSKRGKFPCQRNLPFRCWCY